MCGISGFYCSGGLWNKEDLVMMTQTMGHRGPDAEGYFMFENVGLGHKRLSIIDLSEAANQPMSSECNNYTIVFNGEIYNFKEIAKELNVELHTHSDTEVILKSYLKWGKDCLRRFNGMFAFAIHSKADNSLFIARDRVGIKPIYYYWDGSNFAFASELKAITQLKDINSKLSINPIALNLYLHLGYIPQPHSIYTNVFKFPSANYALLKDNNLSFHCYWNLNDIISSDKIIDSSRAKNTLKQLLIDSVKLRLISDVPFGTFLSGGIDSSLVTAIAQSLSSKPINTFSIGFEYNKFDESKYSNQISEFLGTKHHVYTVTKDEAISIIPDLNSIYDEPFADSSAIPTLMVSKLAKKDVTMTLSGDGGDELFMGYGAYNWTTRLNNPLLGFFRHPIAFALNLGGNRSKRAAKMFSYSSKDDLRSHIFSQEQYFFSRGEIKSLLNPVFFESAFDFNLANKELFDHPAEKQSFFDLNYYLKDDLLVKVDRASMQHSLETRVPILDYRIVEFAFKLHHKLKMNNGVSKYLLKEVLYDYIPQSFFNRPKWGFSVPMNKWLKNELNYLQHEYLSPEAIKLTGVLNLKTVESLKRRFKEDKYEFLYNRLWNLIVLQQFLLKDH